MKIYLKKTPRWMEGTEIGNPGGVKHPLAAKKVPTRFQRWRVFSYLIALGTFLAYLGLDHEKLEFALISFTVCLISGVLFAFGDEIKFER